MWSDPLRLVLPEREAGGQPKQQDTDSSPEYKNPESSDTERIIETPTPEKPVEEAEKTPAPGEQYLFILKQVLIACPGQSAHHDDKSESPPVKPIGSTDASRHRQDPGDPPDADGQRH